MAQGVARIAPGVAGLAAFAGPARPAVAGDDCAEVAAKLGQRRALGHALFYGCAQVGWTAAGERDHHRRAPARAGSDGLKQQVLADWLKAPLQRVKMLAAGEVKYLTREEHEALVTKLNISPSWLNLGERPLFSIGQTEAEWGACLHRGQLGRRTKKPR